MDRTVDVGVISKEDAIAYGMTGPRILRASGVDLDLRKDRPYLGYEKYDFEVPIGTTGDCYDRYLMRAEEVRQSVNIIRQVIGQFPEGAYYAEDAKKDLCASEVQSVDQHGRAYSEFYDCDRRATDSGREVYFEAENPKGALGFFIVSKGGVFPIV